MVIFTIPESEQLWPQINRVSDVRWMVIPDSAVPGRFILLEETEADAYQESSQTQVGDNARSDESGPSSQVCPPSWLSERPTISQFARSEFELPEWVAGASCSSGVSRVVWGARLG